MKSWMHGRTQEHSGDFILCSMLLHCIGQTMTWKNVLQSVLQYFTQQLLLLPLQYFLLVLLTTLVTNKV